MTCPRIPTGYVPFWISATPEQVTHSGTVPKDAVVYSEYTNHIVGTGPIPRGVMSDAPIGNPNHGKNFHVITYHADRYYLHRVTKYDQ